MQRRQKLLSSYVHFDLDSIFINSVGSCSRQSTFCKPYTQFEVDAVTVCVSLAGPMVWYQKFEYAVGHWLHKSAEHVFGCVLCSPGCFSLFRAAALMDDNVMKKYTIKASRARHHIQYDQGN